jgi:hypothetical protein
MAEMTAQVIADFFKAYAGAQIRGESSSGTRVGDEGGRDGTLSHLTFYYQSTAGGPQRKLTLRPELQDGQPIIRVQVG